MFDNYDANDEAGVSDHSSICLGFGITIMKYEAMSEEHTHNCLVEKMAIPEGGVEERMDVSECFEDTDNDVGGYVSVNLKGQGRPISIRSGDNKFSAALSRIIEDERTVAAFTDVLNRPEAQAKIESVEELQNKKTGNTQTLELSTTDTFCPRSIDQADLQGNYIQEKTVAQKKDAENDYPSTDNDETSVHADSGFQSPAKVVSIGHLIESPCKKKYKKELARKKIGTKKSGHGKEGTGLKLVNRERPYPKLIENIHVEDGADTQQGQQRDGIAEHDKEQTICDGSVHRPPESSLGIGQECGSTLITYPDTIDQQPYTSFDSISGDSYYEAEAGGSVAHAVERSISDTGENQPLDLTVKPLDLSVGRNMRPSSTRIYGDDSLAAPYDIASMTTDVRAESNDCTDQYRDTDLSSIESHSQDVVANDAQDLSANQCSVSNDRNLPGLSTLSLDSSAVDRQVSQSGRQHIIDLIAGGQVTVEQLAKLYCSNRKKAAVKQLSTLIPAVERDLQARSCQDPVSPSNRTTEPEQNIPVLAIPNLQYLGLANEDGCIKESKTEQVKNKLKEKLEGKRKS